MKCFPSIFIFIPKFIIIKLNRFHEQYHLDLDMSVCANMYANVNENHSDCELPTTCSKLAEV